MIPNPCCLLIRTFSRIPFGKYEFTADVRKCCWACFRRVSLLRGEVARPRCRDNPIMMATLTTSDICFRSHVDCEIWRPPALNVPNRIRILLGLISTPNTRFLFGRIVQYAVTAITQQYFLEFKSTDCAYSWRSCSYVLINVRLIITHSSTSRSLR